MNLFGQFVWYFLLGLMGSASTILLFEQEFTVAFVLVFFMVMPPVILWWSRFIWDDVRRSIWQKRWNRLAEHEMGHAFGRGHSGLAYIGSQPRITISQKRQREIDKLLRRVDHTWFGSPA